ERVFDTPDANFLVDHSPAAFARFCAFALDASQGGRRGSYGGSILLSHAFDSELVRDVYRSRFGDVLLKEKIEAIVWKESLRVAKLLRERGVDIAHLLSHNERLRFLLPVRNPMDCAVSSLHTGHFRLLRPDGSRDVRDIVAAILDELAWFRALSRAHGQQRFFHFFEFEVDERLFQRLAGFLRLSQDERWTRDAVRCFVVRKGHEHDASLRQWYARRVQQVFAADPEFAEKLARFAG
ncbi:MAG TPA: hypothetical protein VJ875_09090, partial [Pyrinomonadaceae bacterium]|nr:hypothetical protein [Pyrinomonadaceae bacterium]